MGPIRVLGGNATRDEWLAARRQGIGASEIAAVMGLSPWDSPFSIYWRKKLGTEIEMTEAMEWGLRHEQAIADKFTESHSELYLEGDGSVYRHDKHQWMLATPDRLVFELGEDSHDLVGIVQIKTTHSWDGWGRAGTDEVPVYYRAQVQQEMAVMGVQKCWIAALAGGNSYREYLVEFDPDDYIAIVRAGEDFMSSLDADEPPDVDGSIATLHTLKALHPNVVDECVTIPQKLADHYWAAKQLLAGVKAEVQAIENEIRAQLGACRTAVSDGRRVAQRSVYTVSRLDTARLKADHPDLAAEYESVSVVDALKPIKEAAQ